MLFVYFNSPNVMDPFLYVVRLNQLGILISRSLNLYYIQWDVY